MFKNKNAMLIIGVVAVAFTLIAFLISSELNETFWMAYIFGMTAAIIQIPVFKIAFENNASIKSKVLGFPVFRIGYIYLSVQIVVSLMLIIAGNIVRIPFILAIIICVVVLAFALVCSISADIARETVERIDSETQRNTSNMLEMRSFSAVLLSKTNDKALKAELQKLAEAFRFSDPVSSNETIQKEQALQTDLNELASMLSDGSADISDVQAIMNKLSERNEICKLNKKH